MKSSSVPALERGLLVLERLAAHPEPVTLSEIARLCALTVATIQRTVTCLHAAGYLVRESDGSYLISSKLFRIAHEFPPYRDLLSLALPAMHRFASATSESVHLSVLSFNEMLIIGQAEADSLVRLTVKVGSTHDPVSVVSGLILLADWPERERKTLFERRKLSQAKQGMLEECFAQIAKDGMILRASSIRKGVWDLGVPIRFGNSRTTAALTTTFLDPQELPRNRKELLGALRRCSEEIAFIPV
jgi:DNA-binding IclR family transcriptional regulator